MRAWLFVALVACACKAGGDGADAGPSGPMGYPTFEGQYCSRSLSEMPLYTCSQDPNFSLICLTTYQATVTPDGGTPMTDDVFVCRFSCTPEMGCTGNDVCCPGRGINGQTVHGCVPTNACAAPR
jgi:hypothetical protein